MIGVAVSVASGAVTLIVLVLFAGGVITTMRPEARANATRPLRAERAEANERALGDRLGEEVRRREQLEARFRVVAVDALRVGTDADAVELAGGDAGPGRPSDRLLDPFAEPTAALSDRRPPG